VVRAVIAEVGSHRVGLRLSPFGYAFLDAKESHTYALNTYLLEELNKLDLAYVHVVEPRVLGNVDAEGAVTDSIKPFREVGGGVAGARAPRYAPGRVPCRADQLHPAGALLASAHSNKSATTLASARGRCTRAR
jgi:2,4-dienoyl-CoA reductase-like NADH-dependent reductase (Old Yellow Enzyme family)